MYRKVAGIVIGAAAIHGSYVAALGLGEMTMRSALHQPLNAEIKLTNTGDLDADQIRIRLADQRAFDMAGVERTYFLTNMLFNVVRDANGDAVIQVTTKKSVKEPFLDFLVEVRWPTGKVVRSYTALVDLPVYDTSDKPVINRYSAPQQQSQPASTNETYSQPNQVESFSYNQPKVAAVPLQPTDPDGTYRIKNNDTLWEIAKKVRPSSDLSISKTMLALQRNNPNAFPGNNINRIKSGSVLRIPTAAEINHLSKQTTAAIISAQNKQWQGAQLNATEAAAIAAPPVLKEEGHLSLTSSGAGQSDGTQDKGAMQAGVTATNDEALAVTQLENDELNTKVKALSGQISELERLIELKDAEMATMQAQLAEQNAASDVEATVQADTVNVEQPLESDIPAPILAPIEDKLAIQDEDVVSVIEEHSTQEVHEETLEKTSSFAFIKNMNPLHIGIFGLFIMSLVGAFAIQRRNKKEREALATAMNFNYDDLDKPLIEEAGVEEPYEARVEEVPASDDGIETIETFDEVSADTKDEPLVVETDDALGEADIYVAYGRYDQAVELLQSAIATNDDTIPLRNKLLGIYLETDDRDNFRHEYAESLTLGYAPVVSHAKDLLSSSDHSEWLDDIASDVDEDAVTLDDDFSFEQALEKDKEIEETAVLEDEPLDFDESLLTSTNLEDNEGVPVTPVLEDTELQTELNEIDIDLSDLESIDSADSVADSGDIKSIYNSDEDAVDQSKEEETFDIDLSDFDLSFDDESEVESDITPTDNVEDELNLIEIDDIKSGDSALGLSDVNNAVTEEVFEISDSDETSLDDSIEALVQLSEIALGEDEETAFMEEEDSVESFDFDNDPDLSFISSVDEVATKLDLARAYIDMGDIDGAKDMLKEVIEDGEQPQKEEANQLLESCT